MTCRIKWFCCNIRIFSLTFPDRTADCTWLVQWVSLSHFLAKDKWSKFVKLLKITSLSNPGGSQTIIFGCVLFKEMTWITVWQTEYVNMKQFSFQIFSPDVLGLSENSKPCSSFSTDPQSNAKVTLLRCKTWMRLRSKATIAEFPLSCEHYNSAKTTCANTHAGAVKRSVMPTRKGFYCKVMHAHAQPLNTQRLH